MSKEVSIPEELELIDPNKLIPYQDNPNKHEKSEEHLSDSMSQFGFYQPIIIDQKNRIVCGHNRQKRALEKEMPKVPCIRRELTDEQYLEIMMSDNKIAQLSKYDKKTLKTCMELIDAVNKPPVGFQKSEINKMFGIENGTGVEKEEEEKVESVKVKKKTFELTESQHEDITERLKSYKKEYGLNTESEALVKILKNYKRPPKTTKKKGPVKVVGNEES